MASWAWLLLLTASFTLFLNQFRCDCPVIKGEVASIEKRLDKVESQINVSRDRVIAIASVMIALISGCIACVSLAIPIYQFFSQ
jgi:hypothetical protein